MDNLEWGANWVKGDKPIETETGTTHDQKRCKDIQNKHSGPKRKWEHLKCNECGNGTMRNPKFFRKSDPLKYICTACENKKFNNLDEYGIEL